MRFNLSNPLQAKQAEARLSHLIEKGAKIDLTEKKKQRTYSQNAYLHLILTAWGVELGLDLDEMKQMIKMHLSPSLFQYKKKGVTLYRSTADLNTKEMTTLIDKIRTTAMESTGYYIPAPNEQEILQAMANEAERYAQDKVFMQIGFQVNFTGGLHSVSRQLSPIRSKTLVYSKFRGWKSPAPFTKSRINPVPILARISESRKAGLRFYRSFFSCEITVFALRG